MKSKTLGIFLHPFTMGIIMSVAFMAIWSTGSFNPLDFGFWVCLLGGFAFGFLFDHFAIPGRKKFLKELKEKENKEVGE